LLVFLIQQKIEIGDLSSNHFFSKLEAYYERESSSLNTFKKKNQLISKLSLVRVSPILSSARRSA